MNLKGLGLTKSANTIVDRLDSFEKLNAKNPMVQKPLYGNMLLSNVYDRCRFLEALLQLDLCDLFSRLLLKNL